MPFDSTVRLGDIITLLAFLVGGFGFVWTMRGEIRMLAKDVQRQGDKIEKLEAVITHQAVQDQRLIDLERRIEDLRHGRGFVQRDIDGLWGVAGKVKD
jgi:hypothetical protein